MSGVDILKEFSERHEVRESFKQWRERTLGKLNPRDYACDSATERPAKFSVGQVVCIRPCSFERISHVRMSPAGWAYSPDMHKPSRWFPEERLRKLTKRERGDAVARGHSHGTLVEKTEGESARPPSRTKVDS